MQLRLNYVWEDEEYKKMIGIIENVINDYKTEEEFPKAVIHFFTFYIDQIVGIVTNKVFFNSIKNKEQSKLIEQRKRELNDLKEEFFYGII